MQVRKRSIINLNSMKIVDKSTEMFKIHRFKKNDCGITIISASIRRYLPNFA